LWRGYNKTSAGVPADLLEQFPLLEEALEAAGLVVWPMVDFEADDALAAAAALAAGDPKVERVVICTPDKDLAQCVRGTRVVQLNRRTRVTMDEDGVRAKFGVPPESIPDYLALVGDSADGYPGLPGWGPKSTAAVAWRGSATSRRSQRTGATGTWTRPAPAAWRKRWRGIGIAPCCSARLATLRADLPLFDSVEELRWQGAGRAFAEIGARFDAAVTAPRRRTART